MAPWLRWVLTALILAPAWWFIIAGAGIGFLYFSLVCGGLVIYIVLFWSVRRGQSTRQSRSSKWRDFGALLVAIFFRQHSMYDDDPQSTWAGIERYRARRRRRAMRRMKKKARQAADADKSIPR